ncbi:hypothetical protein H0H92_011156 [Tricholoma furcatifolium]|nr:hypothetical protein H0H92_011156 [Tricholoma furcatifolium]
MDVNPLDNRPSIRTPRRGPLPKLAAPLTFYDRHLAEHHRLKQVKPFPEMVVFMLQAEAQMSRISMKDRSVAVASTNKPCSEPQDAYSVALAYNDEYANRAISNVLASRQQFLNLSWGQMNRSEWSDVEHDTAFIEDFGLRLSDTSQTGHPALAFWEVFLSSSDAEAVLMDLGRLSCNLDTGDVWQSPLLMPTAATSPMHLDASTTAWGALTSSMDAQSLPTRHYRAITCTMSSDAKTSELRRSSRVATSKTVPLSASSRSQNIIASRHPVLLQPLDAHDLRWPIVTLPRRKAPSKALASGFLLRAWARAVEHDTTFIVFRCGLNHAHERIGFRHRGSQTLYISDLIEVTHDCRMEYARLQTGLYLSIVHDALERFSTRSQSRVDNESKLEKTEYRTRARVAATVNEARERHALKAQAATRPLAIFWMQYDVYASPTPSYFVRMGSKRQCTYCPSEYFKLILTSEIGSGAVGVVHSAYLELYLGSSEKVTKSNVVVKLAFTKEEIEGIRHEFSVYEYLEERGVHQGIPMIFGLFEDIETNAMALVMSHVGRSLWDLRPESNAIPVKVAASIRDAYVDVITNIHRAGVGHGDLRPENLMISDDGEVTVIDFDQATIDPCRLAKRRELALLTDMLEGGMQYNSK